MFFCHGYIFLLVANVSISPIHTKGLAMNTANLLPAFLLTLFAGLATGIGSAMGFLAKKTNTKFLSVALGFSAGVMIYVSFVEILAKAHESMVARWGNPVGSWAAVGAFFGGIALIGIIDKVIPKAENPHEMHRVEEMQGEEKAHPARLLRTGVLTALAIAIHNFPEGLATFTAALKDPTLGIPIAVAIAIHNIPEGIAVSVPIFYATGKRGKAFAYSFLSGIAEPVGAIVGFALFAKFFGDTMFGILFGMVAGIMVFISIDELLPAAQEYGEHHLSVWGLVAGMAVMAISLLMFL